MAGKDSLTPTRDGQKVLSTLVDGDDIITDLLSVNRFTIRHLDTLDRPLLQRRHVPSAPHCARAFSGIVRAHVGNANVRTLVGFQPVSPTDAHRRLFGGSPLTAPKLTRPGETSGANQGRYLTSGQL